MSHLQQAGQASTGVWLPLASPLMSGPMCDRPSWKHSCKMVASTRTKSTTSIPWLRKRLRLWARRIRGGQTGHQSYSTTATTCSRQSTSLSARSSRTMIGWTSSWSRWMTKKKRKRFRLQLRRNAWSRKAASPRWTKCKTLSLKVGLTLDIPRQAGDTFGSKEEKNGPTVISLIWGNQKNQRAIWNLRHGKLKRSSTSRSVMRIT